MQKLKRQGCLSLALMSLFVACSLFTSCVSTKKVLYFNDLPDTISTPIVMNQPTPFVDPKIESNDILAITVQIPMQSGSNSPITTNASGSFNELNGFLVDKNGFIELSQIGFVKVGGLTTAEAREVIKQKAKLFINEPVVNVRIANFDIEVLGNITKPGKITLTSEKVSIIDAIALSGDIPLSGKRDNVLLIRSEEGQKKFVRFDLTSSKVYQSPYFWLKQRDQIYVQPSRNAIQNSDNTFTRNLGIISALVSLVTILLVLRNTKL